MRMTLELFPDLYKHTHTLKKKKNSQSYLVVMPSSFSKLPVPYLWRNKGWRTSVDFMP